VVANPLRRTLKRRKKGGNTKKEKEKEKKIVTGWNKMELSLN
jgi:hypothetical protein